MTLAQATQKLDWANKRCKYAWAKYYSSQAEAHDQDHAHYEIITTRVVAEDAVPRHIKDMLTTMADELKKKWECPICLDFIPDGSLEITNCGHFYCKPCLAGVKKMATDAHKDKWECAVCRKKHGLD
jgi:rubrerythrin